MTCMGGEFAAPSLKADPLSPLSGGGRSADGTTEGSCLRTVGSCPRGVAVLEGITRPALPQERAMMKPEPSRAQARQLAARRTFLMNDSPPPPPTATTPGLRRRDVMLLVGLCLATLLYGVGNLSLQPGTSDGRENLEMGIQLGQAPNRANHHREPFVPAVIAAVTLAQRALGYEPVAGRCVDWYSKRAETFECRSAYAPYKIVNVGFVLVAGVGVFFLCRWYAGVRWLPHVAFLLVTQSLLGLRGFDDFFTEVPAAALVVMVSCLSALTLVRRRVLYSALLGLVLAALVLTKIVFLYFWPFVVAGLVASDLWQRTLGRRTVLLVVVFLIAHFLPVGGWMARNFVLFDDFSLIDSRRAISVLTLRMTYNTMRDDEFAAGFWYYTPYYKFDLDIPKHSYERLDWKNADGFRQTGFRTLRRLDIWNADGFRRRTQENERLRARIFAEPWRHLKISTLLAWRGLFFQDRLGYGGSPKEYLLKPLPLPRELSPGLRETVLNTYGKGKEAYVVWFREHGTIDGYGEAELKALLNLETVAELANATLYRVPLIDDFAVRGTRVSEFLDTAGASAAHWSKPSGMLHYFRESPLGSIVWSNHVPSLPSLTVAMPRLAEVWGLDSWPHWEWRFDPLSRTVVNLVGFLALLVVPLWFWFGHRRVEVVFVVLPALYLHGVYAVASHFILRYAQPEVPLRIWATLLLVCLMASSVRRWTKGWLKGLTAC